MVELDGSYAINGNSGDIKTSEAAALLTFLQNDENDLVTIVFTQGTSSGSTQNRFAAKEATVLGDGGGSGDAGDFAARLVLELEYIPLGTAIMIK